VRGQLWWWLLLAAFVLGVLNLALNGWLFVLPSGMLFFASNALSMALSIAAVVRSILDLLASVLASLADQPSILGTDA
jgi:hypothetical protein